MESKVRTLVEGPHTYTNDGEVITKNGVVVPPENYRWIPSAIGGTRDNDPLGNSVLRDLKRDLMNIAEGCGLEGRRETAVKRLITDALHRCYKALS